MRDRETETETDREATEKESNEKNRLSSVNSFESSEVIRNQQMGWDGVREWRYIRVFR